MYNFDGNHAKKSNSVTLTAPKYIQKNNLLRSSNTQETFQKDTKIIKTKALVGFSVKNIPCQTKLSPVNQTRF
jgi:hypothetical protein